MRMHIKIQTKREARDLFCRSRVLYSSGSNAHMEFRAFSLIVFPLYPRNPQKNSTFRLEPQRIRGGSICPCIYMIIYVISMGMKRQILMYTKVSDKSESNSS